MIFGFDANIRTQECSNTRNEC